jgi:Tol biopolymer transport system component
MSPKSDRLIFTQSSAIFAVQSIAAARKSPRGSEQQSIVSSTAEDSAPSVSPDGRQFAFQSWRSGSQHIWVSSIDGQTLHQLTQNDGQISFSGSPSWSPAGDQIAFDSRRGGHAHIFVIAPSGGSPRQMTFGEVNDIVPRWSRDGHTLYFRSNRGGRWQLWKISAAGGQPQPLTTDDGMAAQESPDGKWVYFTRGGENGIWRVPVAGGEPERILDQPEQSYWAYWAVGADGIYFLDQRQAEPVVSVYDPATKKFSTFAKLDRLPPYYAGISLIPGKKEMLIADRHSANRHLVIAEGAF